MELKDKSYSKLFCYELESMLDLDIPIYYNQGQSQSIYTSDGTEYPKYFMETAKEQMDVKCDNLCFHDLEHQLMLILLSIACILSPGLAYEDSLYSKEKKNWLDLRTDGGQAVNAWCHGGSGIVLSRLSLFLLEEFREEKRVKIDLARALECLKDWHSDTKVCLCHGMAGKYLILKKCNFALRQKELDEEINRMKAYMVQIKNIPVQELYNISFMSGVMGLSIGLLYAP